MRYTSFIFLICLPFNITKASGVLTLEQFLHEVKSKNENYISSQEAKEGAQQASREGDFIFMPQATAGITKYEDRKPPTIPFMPSYTRNDSVSLGIQAQTPIGVSAKIGYTLTSAEIQGTSTPIPPYYTGAPTFEVNVPLWRNGLGREFRAMSEAAESAQLATASSEEFKQKVLIVESELVYWRLVLARESVRVTRDVLLRAEKMLKWSNDRTKKNLSDINESIQVEAAYQLRNLDHQAAIDEERAAARTFNTLRGISSNEIQEPLERLNIDVIQRSQPQQKIPLRSDTQALVHATRATQASHMLSSEKMRPSIDLFANAVLNSKELSKSDAFSESWGTEKPTYAVGIKVVTPLHFGMARDIASGHNAQAIAAEKALKKKAFDTNQEWNDLEQQLIESKRRLDLTLKLEKTQETKTKNERERLNRGRSTTFQVLQFEQDYSQASFARIRAEADVLRVLAQMKLFL